MKQKISEWRGGNWNFSMSFSRSEIIIGNAMDKKTKGVNKPYRIPANNKKLQK